MNRILERQIKKQLGEDAKPDSAWEKLLQTVSETYDHFDEDRKLVERSLDISSRELMELNSRLKEEAEDKRKILDFVPAMIFYKDRENRYLWANKMLADALGVDQKYLEGKSMDEIYPPEQAEAFLKDDREVIQSGRPKTGIVEPAEIKGKIRWVQTDKIPYRDAAGNIIGIIGFAVDITERKAATEDLRKEKEFSENVINTAQTIILVLDKDGKIVNFNPYLEELSGYRREEMRGKDWFDNFLPPRHREETRALFGQALADVPTRGNVDSIVTKDGRELLIEWYDKTLRDADGKIFGLLAIGQDITERRKAEEETKARAKELERFNKLMVGRELAMVELKKEIRELKKKFGEDAK